MFSVLLTAVIAIGAEPSAEASTGSRAEIPTRERVTVIVDGVDSNCVDYNCTDPDYNVGSGFSCDCIRSSANYPWNWLGSVKQIFRPPQLRLCGLPPWGKRSCSACYGFYDRAYDFRRVFDYQWRSPTYRPRNVASRGGNSSKR